MGEIEDYDFFNAISVYAVYHGQFQDGLRPGLPDGIFHTKNPNFKYF
jgi:hypothetical protein